MQNCITTDSPFKPPLWSFVWQGKEHCGERGLPVPESWHPCLTFSQEDFKWGRSPRQKKKSLVMQGSIQFSEQAQNRTRRSFFEYYAVSSYLTKQQQNLTIFLSLLPYSSRKQQNDWLPIEAHPKLRAASFSASSHSNTFFKTNRQYVKSAAGDTPGLQLWH